jgi:hypothetical protein
MSSNNISLNFINNSNDKNNSRVVIFQKNVDTSFDELAVAWLVIENCGAGWNHPFTYPLNLAISASDSWGNFSPIIPAINGCQYIVANALSGDSLVYNTDIQNQTEVQVLNGLGQGAFTANVYKDGRLLATKSGIPPGEKAVFQFNPTIWIGISSQVEEGEVMKSAVISQLNTELPLKGVASADIILTGGGSGPNAAPYQFTLSNVQYA